MTAEGCLDEQGPGRQGAHVPSGRPPWPTRDSGGYPVTDLEPDLSVSIAQAEDLVVDVGRRIAGNRTARTTRRTATTP